MMCIFLWWCRQQAEIMTVYSVPGGKKLTMVTVFDHRRLGWPAGKGGYRNSFHWHSLFNEWMLSKNSSRYGKSFVPFLILYKTWDLQKFQASPPPLEYSLLTKYRVERGARRHSSNCLLHISAGRYSYSIWLTQLFSRYKRAHPQSLLSIRCRLGDGQVMANMDPSLQVFCMAVWTGMESFGIGVSHEWMAVWRCRQDF